MINEYENAMVPDLIKDTVRQALTGNEPARQRLELIRAFIDKNLTTLEQNAKLGLIRKPSNTRKGPFSPARKR